MPRAIRLMTPADESVSAALAARFDAIRADHKVPLAFDAAVLAEADEVTTTPLLQVSRDETAVPFLTLDPAGSLDLDQALHIARDGSGFRVRYAIANLEGFVRPGGAIDAEARRRGVTVYAPDQRTPLHPPALSEGAASLLPDQQRPAYVWDFQLDSDGAITSTDLYTALIVSRDKLAYPTVQQAIDHGTDDERLMLLKEVGELRIAAEQARGGASLPMPEQDVTLGPDGSYSLHFRPPVACEEWNAQLSLMTGMAAAQIMLTAGVGLLRTMPPPETDAVDRFRREAAALGVPWPHGQHYGDFVRGLDRTDAKQLALIHDAAQLFRGAGYTAFDGQPPSEQTHAAVAAPYAHVTAPLRRLVDRFGLAVCAAVVAGDPAPNWAREALPELPELMSGATTRASAVDRECTNAVEAAVLSQRVGETFSAEVVDRDAKSAVIQILEPAIVARAQGPGEVGTSVAAQLTAADVTTSSVQFQLSSGTG